MRHDSGMVARPVRPIFVVGAPRSGTSIFAWCLGQHPNIVNLPETNWLGRLGEYVEELYRLATVNGQFSHLGAIELPKDDFYRLFGESMDTLIQRTNQTLVGDALPSPWNGMSRRRSPDDPKLRWVDATPQNSESIYTLHKLFPEARFIHLLRNPHEVARSLRRFSRTGGRNYSLRRAYRIWFRFTASACLAERALGSGRVLRVRYEYLVQEPDAVLKHVLAFLDEPYSANCTQPMASRINSSKVDEESLPRPSGIGRRCEALYRSITESAAPQQQGNAAAYAEMKAHFEGYWHSLYTPRTRWLRHVLAAFPTVGRKNPRAP